MKILLFSPVPTHPCNAGNRARVYQLCEALREQGADLHIAFIEQHRGDRTMMENHWGKGHCHWIRHAKSSRSKNGREALRKIQKYLSRKFFRAFDFFKVDIPHDIDDWCGDIVIQEASSLIAHIAPDVVWVEYAYLSRIFEITPNHIFKILDTHDICANRHIMIRQQGRKPTFFYTTPEQERVGCRRADHVIAIQELEQNYFCQNYQVPCSTIGHFLRADPVVKVDNSESIITFIGSKNIINIDGIEWFLKECWPKIIKKLPDTYLEIYGRIGDAIDLNYANNIRLYGNVDELHSAYQKSCLVIAPLRMGTGIKIKCVEALARGKALVATPCAAEGLEEFVDSCYQIADTAEDFVNQCITILQDQPLRERLEKNAVECTRIMNDRHRDALKNVLNLATESISNKK